MAGGPERSDRGIGTVGGVPFFTPRMGLIAAAAALATAISVTLVSGCDTSGGSSAQPSAASSIITSTTRIAGAGVLGNERRPDESCAADPAPVDEGPDPR
jgi:iron complex transport system substrate-binding protein